MKRLRHPRHGYYVPSYGDDLAKLAASGWVPDEPAPPPVVPEPPRPAITTAPASESQRREPWRPRRNR